MLPYTVSRPLILHNTSLGAADRFPYEGSPTMPWKLVALAGVGGRQCEICRGTSCVKIFVRWRHPTNLADEEVHIRLLECCMVRRKRWSTDGRDDADHGLVWAKRSVSIIARASSTVDLSRAPLLYLYHLLVTRLCTKSRGLVSQDLMGFQSISHTRCRSSAQKHSRKPPLSCVRHTVRARPAPQPFADRPRARWSGDSLALPRYRTM